ncbi:MAG: hypothetical protein P8M13_07310, partial [Luminiphilus sp.]|nr:hypothetical protein [Luminiphilus sp.]
MALVLACLVLFAIQSASQATAAPDNVCDSVTLTTQSQIDAFDQNCEIIDGYLKIDGGADGGNIADLTPLNKVQAAYSLVIFNTNKLTNLKGLEGLASVTQCVLIQENEGLVSLTGMESLKSIGGAALDYGVSQCSNLGLLVRWNELLTDLDGLKNLNSLAGNLDLYNNDQMTSIAGLGALQNVELSDLAIWDNKRLPN